MHAGVGSPEPFSLCRVAPGEVSLVYSFQRRSPPFTGFRPAAAAAAAAAGGDDPAAAAAAAGGDDPTRERAPLVIHGASYKAFFFKRGRI